MADKEIPQEIGKVWYILMRDKKMQVKTVLERIPKERLSPESLKDERIAKEVEQSGYYDAAHRIPEPYIKALDYLVKLGYVEKSDEKIYRVTVHYEAYPYLPYISPLGYVGISNPTNFSIDSYTFDSKQFDAFVQTAKQFGSQLSSGQHPHIKSFDYGFFYYETVVYEVKDRYFDAVQVSYSNAGGLKVTLTEPYIESDGKRDYKRWRPLKSAESEIFLSGSTKFDNLIEELEWKKRTIGVILYKDKAYWLLTRQNAEQYKKQEEKSLEPPNFLDKRTFSHENLLAHMFTDKVALYLNQKFGYVTATRVTPQYLKGREIDVFAEKDWKQNSKMITVCECKLRFSDSPITLDEVKEFEEKIDKVKEQYNQDKTKFHFWTVTNIDKLESGVKEYGKGIGIKIMEAHIPKDWRYRSDWMVSEISDL